MALDSDFQIREIRELTRIYQQSERKLRTILNSVTATAFQRARATDLLAGIESTIQDLQAATDAWMAKTLPASYRAGQRLTADTYGLPLPTFSSPARAAVASIAGEIAENLRSGEGLGSVAPGIRAVFIRAQQQVVTHARIMEDIGEATLEGMTPRQLARNLVQTLKDGATRRLAGNVPPGMEEMLTATAEGRYVIMPSGRRIRLTDYGETLARTATREAQSEGVVATTQEFGQDLVQVSVHAGACPLCQEIQGKIFSIKGDHADFPPLSDAVEPPLHPRCEHVLLPVVESFLKEKGIYDGLSKFSKGEQSVQSIAHYSDLIRTFKPAEVPAVTEPEAAPAAKPTRRPRRLVEPPVEPVIEPVPVLPTPPTTVGLPGEPARQAPVQAAALGRSWEDFHSDPANKHLTFQEWINQNVDALYASWLKDPAIVPLGKTESDLNRLDRTLNPRSLGGTPLEQYAIEWNPHTDAAFYKWGAKRIVMGGPEVQLFKAMYPATLAKLKGEALSMASIYLHMDEVGGIRGGSDEEKLALIWKRLFPDENVTVANATADQYRAAITQMLDFHVNDKMSQKSWQIPPHEFGHAFTPVTQVGIPQAFREAHTGQGWGPAYEEGVNGLWEFLTRKESMRTLYGMVDPSWIDRLWVEDAVRPYKGVPEYQVGGDFSRNSTYRAHLMATDRIISDLIQERPGDRDEYKAIVAKLKFEAGMDNRPQAIADLILKRWGLDSDLPLTMNRTDFLRGSEFFLTGSGGSPASVTTLRDVLTAAIKDGVEMKDVNRPDNEEQTVAVIPRLLAILKKAGVTGLDPMLAYYKGLFDQVAAHQESSLFDAMLTEWEKERKR